MSSSHASRPEARSLCKADVFRILSNPRRRETVRSLGGVGDAISVYDLSEAIAAAEAGTSPAPRQVRETVYVSLHQTHLPALHELGVVEYDREHRRVRALGPVRVVRQYMEVEAAFGVSWSTLYRSLGVVGLAAVVGSLAEVPLIETVDPLLLAAGFLAAFTVAGLSELRSYGASLRGLFGSRRRARSR